MSRFLELHTPVTSAPNDFAICTANVPTPPDAPLIRIFCPGCAFALSRTACNAVSPAISTEPACSNVMLAGFRATPFSETETYSAKAPVFQPNTSSPGLNCVTFFPTASIVPAKSTPIRVTLGLRKPTPSRMM